MLDSELPVPPEAGAAGSEATAATQGLTGGALRGAPPPGLRQYGPYEVEVGADGRTPVELGRGAMGVTYRARDRALETLVAIKVIAPGGLPGHVQARERFRREARAAARLRHPNVASVFFFGETARGESFYAMELVEGETLAARVARAGPLPVALALEVAFQVAQALLAADEHGLIHRDLKPANLMLAAAPPAPTATATRGGSRAGRPPSSSSSSSASPSSAASTRLTSTPPPPPPGVRVKVIDFGLAKAVGGGGEGRGLVEEAALTEVGGFLGTPAYASPEQAEGRAGLDARSDLYSLGATLWFALTGRVPFAGRTLGEIYERQRHRALPVGQLRAAGVPAAVEALLASLLAAEPARRPAGPAALLEALARCREELGGGSGATGGTGRGGGGAPSPPASSGQGRRRLLRLGGGLLFLLLLAGGAGLLLFFWVWPRPQGIAPAPAPAPAPVAPPDPKSLAVLPLEDLSADQGGGGAGAGGGGGATGAGAGGSSTFFADGIQDDLLGSLARIGELKVISRSSVMAYRDPARRNLADIGRALGVAHVLEGSVRRAGRRVLVNVALTETASGRQVWAERYDRTLEDALTLQGELAAEIAQALKATLSPEERARVEARPTDSADAYVLYLRARDYQTRPNVLLQDYQTAERLYGQAIALDPGFALAYARLSAVLAYTYENFRPIAEVRDQARAAAETALRLQPDLGEGYLARALCFYWTEKDYEGAIREMEVAARLLPNNSEIDRYSGAIRRRQGRWVGAVDSMRRALVRDPRSAQIARELMRTECLMRDWPAAARDGQRAVAIAPDNLLLQFEKCSVDFWSRGDLAPIRAVLAAVPPGVDPDGVITLTRWEVDLVARDFAAAEQTVTKSGLATVGTQFGIMMPKSYFLGSVALARGDTGRAKPLMEEACAAMETQARQLPQDAFRQARLGLFYAYLGRKEEAIRQGLRAVELLPESKDTYLGPSVSATLALIYARTGEVDQAITLLDRLLRTPGGLLPGFEGNITQNDLRQRWQWDPLRANPRFQALVNGPEPKTVYK